MKNQAQNLYRDGIRCYLPANSTAPVVQAASIQPTVIQPATLCVLREIVQASHLLQQQIERHILPMSCLSESFVCLGQLTAQAHHLLAAEVAQAGGILEPDGVGLTHKEGVSDEVLVDRIFMVIRLPEMSFVQWAMQIVESSTYLLQDLPFAVLSIDEVAALVAAIQALFHRLVSELDGQTSESSGDIEQPSVADRDFLATHHALIHHWQAITALAQSPMPSSEETAKRERWEKQVTHYRWCVGHHFFFLCTIYCSDALHQAAHAFKQGEIDTAAEQLNLATGYLRGTTAAMWYASNFPAHFYQNQVRAYLNEVGPPGGPSGTMMLDYQHLLRGKEVLQQTLLSRYGNNPRQWPPLVRHTVQTFHEIYVEDMEQHTLLAASKVGIDSSLSQKVWQADLPSKFAVGNAIDTLRNMTSLRRTELKF